jgi:hypothetical protein
MMNVPALEGWMQKRFEILGSTLKMPEVEWI